MSAIWITCLVLATPPRAVSGFGRTSGLRLRASAYAGGALCMATTRNASPSRRNSVPNVASQMRTAFARMVWNTGSKSPGELEMTRSTSEVAVCCSSASERCPRASASSRVRASSCFFNSISELGPLLTRSLAFVPVGRSRVGLFASLRDKITSSAQSLAYQLTEPHDELASLLDHLVGERKQRCWYFQAKCLSGLEIDD